MARGSTPNLMLEDPHMPRLCLHTSGVTGSSLPLPDPFYPFAGQQ